jgi:hypothetical protein
MSARYLIAPSITLVLLEGVVTDEEVINRQREMFEDPQYVGDYPHVIDLSEVTDLQLSSDVIRRLAQNACERGMTKAAIIATKEEKEVVFGLSRMYEAYACEAEVEIFSTRDEALVWLSRRMSATA